MKVTLLDYTQDAEYKIGAYAAECYDSDTSREACIRRAKSCKDHGHLATLSFAYATFRIEGISRVCSHQVVRHAHLRYLQRSQRYTSAAETVFVDPAAVDSLECDDLAEWAQIQQKAITLYDRLVSEKKLKKEDARFILPQSCDTSITITGNFQAWLDFLKLRTAKHAQQEIRDVATQIGNLMSVIAPNIFADYNLDVS